jgi:type II restriction enzyme
MTLNLKFDPDIAKLYKSLSQKIRILSESWVNAQGYCPACGFSICKYSQNKPVADFYCQNCLEDFELKSKKESFGKKVLDGAYKTMIERLESVKNPNLFLLNYHPRSFVVLNFLVIPKHFFVSEIIEKRFPLSAGARRAGYIGCNVLIDKIPQSGRIFLVKNGSAEPKRRVINTWNKTLFLREKGEVKMKGWILDVMNCVDALGKKEFTLEEIYTFEKKLLKKYPENKHIKDKIRQQLQFLRNKGYLQFLGRGKYKIL